MERPGCRPNASSSRGTAASTSDKWLAGFGDTEEAVRKERRHGGEPPVMPPHVRVIGFILDSDTGELYPGELLKRDSAVRIPEHYRPKDKEFARKPCL